MKKIKYTLIAIIAFFSLSSFSQELKELWASGSAVPNGVQKLTCTPDRQFRLIGGLRSGEVRIQTTEKVNAQTKFLVPTEADALLITDGMSWKESDDAQAAGWQVLFDDPHYRVSIDTESKILRGEIVKPWGELLIGGGATLYGWDRLKMQPFKQDGKNPYLWVWTGELRPNEKSEEPLCFKLEGQLAWGPKQLHPLVDGEDVLQSSHFRFGGADTKWKLTKAGRYRLTVDLLYETIKAQYLGN